MDKADEAPRVGESVEEAADDLADRLSEIEGIAHVIDRCLYHEEAAEYDRVRFAVRGIMRLADMAGDAATALAERIAPIDDEP
ncbi:MAG TPA: hypothetical protein VFF06_02660 [Polyangia bacterium]|nr:hypothetical protein [Polyangia bacterium]